MNEALPVFSPSLNKPLVWVLAAISVLMLIAMIAYPMGYDQAVFSVGGETVLRKGAIPYRDILDTKPPLIFYLYAFSSLIFGHHLWAIRAFDILFQAACSIYFYKILRRFVSSELALASVSIAVIQYVGSGFWMTAQAESFALLPALLLADYTLRYLSEESQPLVAGALTGVAAVVLLLLKFTFVAGWFAALGFLLLLDRDRRKDFGRFVLGSLLSFILLLVAYALWLSATGSLDRFLEGLRWVSDYASLDPLLGRSTISEKYYQLFPDRLVFSYSLTLLLCGVWGLGKFLRRPADFGAARTLLGLFALTWAVNLVGVLSERKMFPYHFIRGFWSFAPFIAIGISSAARAIWSWWNAAKLESALTRITRYALIVAVICAALFYSPVVKLFSQSIPWLMMLARHQATGDEVNARIKDYYAGEQARVGEYLRSTMTASDQLFFWGNDVAVYFNANKLPPTFCLTATPLRTAWTPPQWRRDLIGQLVATAPRYFVTEFNDVTEYITGSPLDSYAALKAWPELNNFLSTRYSPDTTIGHYLVFRRNS